LAELFTQSQEESFFDTFQDPYEGPCRQVVHEKARVKNPEELLRTSQEATQESGLLAS
jgi:hypothetical protein